MSSSDGLTGYVRAVASARGIPLHEDWLPAVELHLKRLLDAAAAIDQSEMKAQELAPKFEP